MSDQEQQELPSDVDLHRMVQAHHLDEGRLTSALLSPTSKDDGKLSVDRGDMSTAQESFDRFTEKFSAVGVVSVQCSAFQSEGLRVIHAPLPDNPAHSLVDYTNLSGNQRKQTARRLAVGLSFSYRPQPD